MARSAVNPQATAPEHDLRACDGSLRRAFAFLGKRWNGVILAILLEGPTGFADLSRAVQGISDSVLAERLGELSRAGLVSRVVHAGPPVSVRYELTESGSALTPALRELKEWATRFLPESDCPTADDGPCLEL